MVHGNFYGIKYVIYLNKEIDFYFDFLPICISVRAMMEFKDKVITVIPYSDLDKRFYNIKESSDFIKSMDKIEYNPGVRNNREENPDIFFYKDVFTYSDKIKNMNFKPISSDELEALKEERRKLFLVNDDYSIEWSKKITQLNNEIDLQTVICNSDYLVKVVEMEKKLTDIQLTDQENQMINDVLSHPKLEGLVKASCLQLVKGIY